MNSIELIGPFLSLLTIIILCVCGAYVTRTGRLSVKLNDYTLLDFPAGYVSIVTMVTICLIIVYGMWI